MTKQNNAAQVAVKAAACPDTPAKDKPQDVFDCMAMDLPRAQWAEAMAEPAQKLAPVDCSAVFGEKWPEDVIAPIRVAQERLSWLEHLFNCIATDPQAGLRAQRLAEMGRFVASEASDLADCCHTDMLEAIKKGGAA